MFSGVFDLLMKIPAERERASYLPAQSERVDMDSTCRMKRFRSVVA